MSKIFFPVLLSVLVGSVGSSLAQAEVAARFKNFAPGKDGVWETTTTTAASPQPMVQKSCVDAAKSKEMVDKMLSNPNPMAQCKVKILVDTKDAAESQQTCVIANFTTNLSMKMKKVNDTTFESVVESDTAGKKTTAKMVSKYLGPCTAADKAAQSAKMNDSCAKCKTAVDQMKAKCKAASGPEKQMCSQSVPQIESMCQMSCAPTHG